jgi:hypothetical protein
LLGILVLALLLRIVARLDLKASIYFRSFSDRQIVHPKKL